MIKDIKLAIIQKLSAISTLNKVYGFEKVNPDGFPAAFVTFASNDNEFYTTAENKRIFGYRVLVLVQIGQNKNSTDKVEQAEEAIQDIVGDVLDSLDSDITLGESADIVFMEASIGEPGYVEYEGGWARSAEIMVRVHSVYVV